MCITTHIGSSASNEYPQYILQKNIDIIWLKKKVLYLEVVLHIVKLSELRVSDKKF